MFDLVKGGRRKQVILERAAAPLTFEIDVASEEKYGWQLSRKIARAITQNIDKTEAEAVKSYINELWGKQEYDEIERKPCGLCFKDTESYNATGDKTTR